MENYTKMIQLVLASAMIVGTMLFLFHYYIKYAPVGLVKNGSKMKDDNKIYIIVLLLSALVIKIILSGMLEGFESDIACFKYWGQRMITDGAGQMYNPDAFTDYPPGYLYVLGVLAWICKIFNIDNASALSDVIIKFPACLCDVCAGYLIYKIARKRIQNNVSLMCAAIYIFNPAVMINSAVWGQVDSVYVFFVILMLYFILEHKLPAAYVVFGVGFFVKPQMAFFFPILVWGIIEQVFMENFTMKRFLINLFSGLGAIALMFILAIPFGVDRVISQMMDTITSYPYASVNAYNMWAMFGKTWCGQTDTFLGLAYSSWGTIFLVLVVGSACVLLYRAKKNDSKYFLVAAYIMAGIFTFSVRMHERYMFPVMILLLFAYIMKPIKQIFYAYIGFSVVQLLNVGHVLYYYDPQNFNAKANSIVFISSLTVAMFIYLFYVAYKYYFCGEEQSEVLLEAQNKQVKEEAVNKKEYKLFEDGIQPSAEKLKMLKLDWIVMLAIIAIYSIIALTDLGDTNTPNTEYLVNEYDSTVVMDFGEKTSFSKISYYLGNYERRNVTIDYSNDGVNWTNATSFEMTSVMCWGLNSFTADARYLRMTCSNNAISLFELVVLDKDGNVVTPVNGSDYPNLFDEQEKYAERTYLNGTYFDEIYHARTAYEYIQNRYCYENTHPPLGKGFIALGMLIFGVCPFGWRIMGVLFGIAMLPLIYLFTKKLFKETWISGVVTTLFAFDFMHFTQTRIATIDVFVTFFVIGMYFFMYCYTKRSWYDRPIMRTWGILGMSGVCMGLGVASKWTGVYAGLGLAVLFFVDLYRRYREYRFAKTQKSGSSNGIAYSTVVKKYKNYAWNTILVCCIFFVFVPILIYIMAYIPFDDSSGAGLITMLLKNQETMFSYHSDLVSEHPYSSFWYQWPLMVRPIFYYSRQVTDTVSEGISAFGNPLVWFAGIPAVVYMFYLLFKKRDKNALFLLVGYFAQYLPWMLISRTTYIYHYFPSVPFVTLMIGYSIYNIVGGNKKRIKWAILYATAAVALFALFYPVLSGHAVEVEFVKTWLKWFDKWVLII